MILLLYVYDLFVTGVDGLIADTKRKLVAKFKMKELGMMHYFLGMEMWQNVDGISLGQGKYAVEILKRFGMMDCKAIATPIASIDSDEALLNSFRFDAIGVAIAL